MKLGRLILAAVFVCLCAAEDLPQLVIDPSVDRSKIDIDMWAQALLPKLVAISGQHNPPKTITIKIGAFDYLILDDSGTSIMVSSYPNNPGDIYENAYVTITHEMAHALSPIAILSAGALSEGLAETMKDHAYAMLRQEKGTGEYSTNQFLSHILNNADARAAADSPTFRSQLGNPYNSATGPLELLLQTEADFKTMGYAIEDANLDYIHGGPTEQEWFNILVGIIAKALPVTRNGMDPTTLLNQMVAVKLNGPDGCYFTAYPFSSLAGWLASNTMTAINPLQLQTINICRRDGVATRKPDTVNLTITDAFGAVKYTGSGDIGDVFQYVPLPDISKWPDGGYKVYACTKTGNLCDTTYFGNIRTVSDWMYKGVAVILDPYFGSLDEGSTLKFASDSAILRFPGLALFRNVGTDVQITVQTGFLGTVHTFSPYKYATPVYLLTNRPQPCAIPAERWSFASCPGRALFHLQRPNPNPTLSPRLPRGVQVYYPPN